MEDQRTLTLELVLPDDLAHEAEANGLLTSQALAALLRAELHRLRIAQVFEAAEQLAALPLSPLTQAEVEAEIQAARLQRRSTHANDS
jgi:post-segregation antitoxin (ccd killing protein)